MSFYNPYMQTPDYGQGIQDITSRILQMIMMKRMFPGQDKEGEQLDLQAQGAGGIGTSQGTPWTMNSQLGQTPLGGGGMDPMLLQMLMRNYPMGV